MIAAYIYDSDLRLEANEQGKNYWYEYIKEMNEQLGLCPEELSRKSLEDAKAIEDLSLIFIGDLKAYQITDAMRSNVDLWVKSGGVLIGFATEGLDEIFGNSCDAISPSSSSLLQSESDYSDYMISGYFSLKSDPLTVDIHSYLHPDQKLMIFSKPSSIRRLIPKSSTEIAPLYEADGTDTGYAAITKRDYYKGRAYYFGFNVPQTLWVLHQGIPITQDRDGDGYYRTGDLIAIGDNEPEVLYADELLFLIQNMIAQKPQPLIYQLPPVKETKETDEKGGRIPDALFYWGGDDEAMEGVQLLASNWMRQKGLPYHINIMPNKEGKFAITAEEAKAVLANGHECSVHYNFIDNFKHPIGFEENDVRAQAQLFYESFGFRHTCSVNHWVRWSGWTQPAKWMRAAGGRADNSFVHYPFPPINPTNRLGFVFGTSYPFYFYDDYENENAKIDFLEEPITAYEIGYNGETTDFETVHKVIDIAAKYHLTLNMFYHPVYLCRYPACQAAIEEFLRYIEEKGIIAVHKGNDGLWEWWDKRSRSKITDVNFKGNDFVSFVSFTTFCEYDDGMIVKVPIKVPIGSDSAQRISSVKCDDQAVASGDFKLRYEFGGCWLYLVVPSGNHKVEVNANSIKPSTVASQAP